MVECVPFAPEHAERIRLQPCQQAGHALSSPQAYRAMAAMPSFSVVDGDEVVMSGGIVELWPGRAICWALLAEHIGHRMTACVRATRKFLTSVTPHRLELDVQEGHEEGHRFARMIGFEKETERLRAFYPDGSDGTMYVRVTA